MGWPVFPMRIRHIYPSASCRREVAGPISFLIGSASTWCQLCTERSSRYDGWFVEDARTVPGSFIKILERVTYVKGENQEVAMEPQGITVTGEQAFWEYGDGSRLGFYALPDVPALRLQTGRPLDLKLSFDIRGIYQSPDLGRNYQVHQVPGGLFVQYNDELLGQTVYVALKTDGAFSVPQEWEAVTYPWDIARHSEPGAHHTYTLGVARATWLTMGAGATAEAAQQACTEATNSSFDLVGIGIAHAKDSFSEEVRAAQHGAAETLEVLMHQTGTYAGLPWFHQVWTRDELIAALGMTPSEQLTVIKKYLATPLQKGELPTFIGSGTTCADGVGWLALLIREFSLKELSAPDQKKALHFFREALDEIKANHWSETGLVTAEFNSTWMDTIGRKGCPLEIQTMFSLVLELLGDLTKDKSYQEERETFLSTVRNHFFQKNALRDGEQDDTLRPNCFLAYLLQPGLLKAQEWERTFGTALAALRTSWGGLSSLNRADPRYQPASTGEDNRSYHNGDSWFFINNLVGVALNRFGMKVFKPVVDELLKGSTEEILWKHVAGQAGEIASAGDGTSWGCGVQAFAAGTYLFFTEELGL